MKKKENPSDIINLKEWQNSQPQLALEEYAIYKLSALFDDQTEPGTIKRVSNAFDYDIWTKREPEFRHRMAFKYSYQEQTIEGVNGGRRVEACIVAVFSYPKDTAEEDAELILRLSGINVLYGLLRGIIASATALLPGGAVSIPVLTAQRIVADVETQKAKRELQNKNQKKQTP